MAIHYLECCMLALQSKASEYRNKQITYIFIRLHTTVNWMHSGNAENQQPYTLYFLFSVVFLYHLYKTVKKLGIYIK